MWNLEIDDEESQSEDFVKSAMESVLAVLVEVSLICSATDRASTEQTFCSCFHNYHFYIFIFRQSGIFSMHHDVKISPMVCFRKIAEIDPVRYGEANTTNRRGETSSILSLSLSRLVCFYSYRCQSH